MFGDTSAGRPPEDCRGLSDDGESLLRRHSSLGDSHGDPMEAMGNLFDVAILIGLGFLVTAIAGMGVQQTAAPAKRGLEQMKVLTAPKDKQRKVQATEQTATGTGAAVGTVFRLDDGTLVWVAGEEPSSTPQP